MLQTIATSGTHTFGVLLGLWLVYVVIISTIQTLVLPRGIYNALSAWLHTGIYEIFLVRVRFARQLTYEKRDDIMALYGPTTLVMLPFVWLALVLAGYSFIYWGVGYGSLWDCVLLSGSSLLTLGSIPFPVNSPMIVALIFVQAMTGMILVALLIAYLPTIYAAFSERERAVTQLDTSAGSPPSPVMMLARLHRIGDFEDNLNRAWIEWRDWFTAINESQTSLSILNFFRSPKPDRSWVTAAGVVLDTAALTLSVVDIPRDAKAMLTIRAGYVALQDIASFFGIPYNATPTADDPISISRQEFDAVCAELEASGVPLKSNRDIAWRDFKGWRVNYDIPLIQLAALTSAPYAMWVSDRSVPGMTPANEMIRLKHLFLRLVTRPTGLAMRPKTDDAA